MPVELQVQKRQMKEVYLVGVNYQTCPIRIREKLSFSDLSAAYRELNQFAGISDKVILSTCNRSEIYLASDDLTASADFVKRWIHQFNRFDQGELDQYFYQYAGARAISHLFHVIAGLKSMVIGEPQICGQVKQAFFKAKEHHAVGAFFNRLFESAFQVNKAVRTNTDIGRGRTSISHIAIDLAKKIFNPIADRKILLIGAGEMIATAGMLFKKNSVPGIVFANRTDEKARRLATEFSAESIPFDHFRAVLNQFDIILTATSAKNWIIAPDHISTAMAKRNNEPLLIIDLGVPRDIDPAVDGMTNVFLYNIDELKAIADANERRKDVERAKAQKIIRHAELKFLGLSRPVDMRQIVKDLDAIHADELAHLSDCMADLSDAQRKVIETLFTRYTKKVSHYLFNRLKGKG